MIDALRKEELSKLFSESEWLINRVRGLSKKDFLKTYGDKLKNLNYYPLNGPYGNYKFLIDEESFSYLDEFIEALGGYIDDRKRES